MSESRNRALEDYLRLFTAGTFANALSSYNETGDEPELVHDFIAHILRSELYIPFDWLSWTDEAKRYLDDTRLIDTADRETLQKLMTTFVRQDRFVGGFFASLCNTDVFPTILRRWQVLQAYTDNQHP